MIVEKHRVHIMPWIFVFIRSEKNLTLHKKNEITLVSSFQYIFCRSDSITLASGAGTAYLSGAPEFTPDF